MVVLQPGLVLADLPVEFVHGSYIPRSAERVIGRTDAFAWLAPAEGDAYEELDCATEDYGLIFAYPWPDEERLIGTLFERCASAGSVLVTYHEKEEVRVRRKK